MTERLSKGASGTKHLRWGREILATIDAHVAHNDIITEAQKTALRSESATLTGALDALDTADGAYQAWLRTALLGVRAELRVANYLADETHLQVEAALRPRRAEVAQAIPGGIAAIFSNKPMSTVLRAGHERTAQFARTVATMIADVPASVTAGIPGLPALATRAATVAARLDTLIDRRDRELAPQRAPLAIAVDRRVFELREGLAKMDARLREHFSPAFIESLYPDVSRNGKSVVDDVDENDDTSDVPKPS